LSLGPDKLKLIEHQTDPLPNRDVRLGFG